MQRSLSQMAVWAVYCSSSVPVVVLPLGAGATSKNVNLLTFPSLLRYVRMIGQGSNPVVQSVLGKGDAPSVLSAATKGPVIGGVFYILFAFVPMFLVADEYRIDILMPIFVLCFALATVWLLPVLAWAVEGCDELHAIGHELARALPESARRTFLTAVPASRRLLELGEALGLGARAK